MDKVQKYEIRLSEIDETKDIKINVYDFKENFRCKVDFDIEDDPTDEDFTAISIKVMDKYNSVTDVIVKTLLPVLENFCPAVEMCHTANGIAFPKTTTSALTNDDFSVIERTAFFDNGNDDVLVLRKRIHRYTFSCNKFIDD